MNELASHFSAKSTREKNPNTRTHNLYFVELRRRATSQKTNNYANKQGLKCAGIYVRAYLYIGKRSGAFSSVPYVVRVRKCVSFGDVVVVIVVICIYVHYTVSGCLSRVFGVPKRLVRLYL